MDITSPKRETRRLTLIADFNNKYADGWCFAVHEAFRDSLDIKWTSRIIQAKDINGQPAKDANGKKITETIFQWTQGNLFNFNAGAIIYDNSLAYELPWNEALKYIKLFIQITEATPSVLTENMTIQYGEVKFKLYKPNADYSGIEEMSKLACTQEEFVSLLKNGSFKILSNETINLFNSFNDNRAIPLF